MKLIVNICDNDHGDDVFFSKGEISIFTTNGKNIFSLVNNKKIREEVISDLESENEMDPEIFTSHNNDIIAFLNELKENLSLIDFDDIEINFKENIDPLEFKTFLEKITCTLTINLNGLSNQNIIKLKSIKFKTKPISKLKYNNDANVSLDASIIAIEIVENIKDYINRYELSPLEQLLFLYDLVKERIYKKENVNVSSRNLSNVLCDENIICTGFINIYSAASSALGFKTMIKQYKSDEVKHDVLIVYISDSKYNFHAPLEFDPTWDSKKNDNDTEYVDKYIWFGLNETVANKVKKVVKELSPIDSTLDKINKLYNNLETDGILNSLLKAFNEYFKAIKDAKGLAFINEYYNNINDLSDSEIRQLIDELMEYTKETCNRKLDYNSFAIMLYSVRRIEHRINPKLYPLSEELIKKICNNRFSREEILYYTIMSDEPLSKILSKQRYMRNIKGPKKTASDIKRMELLYNLGKHI